ncbi:site-specific integrase [Vibrio rotiferianus]|uniref:site-specific integrase n=1 Tax=Vibrio rotiferianus TaxID=190895 RepID=UPI001C70B306|nr:site-specific integrase [Vibrio rotiferianus]
MMVAVVAFKLPKYENAVRVSKEGYQFNLSSDKWKVSHEIEMTFHLLPDSVSSDVEMGLRLTLARMAEEVSPYYARNCLHYIRSFFFQSEHYTGGQITEIQILNLKGSLSREDEYKLGTIRALLRNWIEWEYPGVQKGITPFLDSLKLHGNVKGKAVLHSCPHSGPWTVTEQQLLMSWAANAFLTEQLNLREYAWFMICYQTARRPIQLRQLRIGDLSVEVSKGKQIYSVSVPRAKKRGEDGGFRKSFRSLSITEDLFLILINLAEQVQKLAKENLPKLTKVDLTELPLFIGKEDLFDGICSVDEFRESLKDEPAKFHMNIVDSSDLTRVVSRKCNAISERTGETIHFTPTRCRRTRATNLVRHGISGVQLAYLLDHEDTQNIGVYTGYTPELALRIFSKMNEAMVFLAAMFEERLITDESEAIRSGDPASRRHINGMKHVGNCGGSACDSGIKICVSCSRFQPLLHAPWDELLVDLTEEMEDRRENGASDLVLQSYDLAIVHVAAILKACDGQIQVLNEGAV